MKKKGVMEWEYLAAILLVLIVVFVILLFMGYVKGTIAERAKEFIKNLLGG